MQTTEYYVLAGHRLQNISELIPKDALEDVLDELQEIAEPTPGDEDYAQIYTKVFEQRHFERCINPELTDMLEAHADSTGKDYAEILQWATHDGSGYYLLGQAKLTDLTEALGESKENVLANVLNELQDTFEDLADNLEPAYVRAMNFEQSDLYEDEGNSEALRNFIANQQEALSTDTIYVFQWTE